MSGSREELIKAEREKKPLELRQVEALERISDVLAQINTQLAGLAHSARSK